MRPLQFILKADWSRKTLPDSFVFPIILKIKEDLRWWLEEGRFLAGKSLFHPSPNLKLFSNASDRGCGAVLGHLEVSETWSLQERKLHINLKELKAIHLAPQHFAVMTGDTVVQCIPTKWWCLHILGTREELTPFRYAK